VKEGVELLARNMATSVSRGGSWEDEGCRRLTTDLTAPSGWSGSRRSVSESGRVGRLWRKVLPDPKHRSGRRGLSFRAAHEGCDHDPEVRVFKRLFGMEKLGVFFRLPDQVHLEGEGLPRDHVGDRDRGRECHQAEITGDLAGLVRGFSLATEGKAICADVSLNDHEQRAQSGRCGHRVRPSRSGPMPRRRQGFSGQSSRFIALKTSTSFF
jgi:hypothetical protein